MDGADDSNVPNDTTTPTSNENQSAESSKFAAATHKLKAEALRRLQLPETSEPVSQESDGKSILIYFRS